MHWADKIVEDIESRLKDKIEAGPLTIRDEKTASGSVHVGAMRGVALHGILSNILKEHGIENTFLYEINDFDAFDTVPKGVPEDFKEHLGKPLFAVPNPIGKEGNYAEHFGTEFARVIEATGFTPEFYSSSEEYLAGKYNEVIRTALDNWEKIGEINKEVSGSERTLTQLPIMMICEQCGKVATTRGISFDGKEVTYACDQEASGAMGCGYEGKNSPFDGKAKLTWKVEWAAKFKVFTVDIEGEGKDLATKGGARDVANHISREVFKYEPPYDQPYEFLLVGGKKMSSSKGNAATAVSVAEILPTKIFRTMLLGRDIKRAINFDPTGDTIPLLFDQYDTVADKYWNGVGDDDARLFELVHEGDVPKKMYLHRFSQVAYLVQMPHIDIEKEAEKAVGTELSKEEREELQMRAEYAKLWLKEYAPEDFKFELQVEAVPEGAKDFPPEVKELLQKVVRYIVQNQEVSGQELHTALHDIRRGSEVEPADFFKAVYLALLGKESGPKAGWFLSVLPRDFLIKRLTEVSN